MLIVVGKITELQQRAQGCSIIGVMETWATSHINDGELSVEGYNMLEQIELSVKVAGYLCTCILRINSHALFVQI